MWWLKKNYNLKNLFHFEQENVNLFEWEICKQGIPFLNAFPPYNRYLCSVNKLSTFNALKWVIESDSSNLWAMDL